MWKFTQRSFVGGRLDAELMGRQDLAKYFQGASELKNFLVCRQGNITKRRGTDFVADFTGILGRDEATGERVAIYESRLFPIVYTNDEGFYTLITAGRAFLISRKSGIRLMDGTWASEIQDFTAADYADEVVADDKRPYYVKVPFSDDALAKVDYCQVGDTIYFAHASYPPTKMAMYHNDNSLSVSAIDFMSQKWARPAIASCTGTDFAKEGAEKTVYYVCTYVKDGIESLPSLPYAFTYHLPWASTASVKLTFDKGDNETEPDYYNVYKKETTGYGLISTLGSSTKVYAFPTANVSSIEGDFNTFLNSGANSIIGCKGSVVFVQRRYHPVTRDTYRWTATTSGSGGYSAKTALDGITYAFGDSSNLVISQVKLCLDITTSSSNIKSEKLNPRTDPWTKANFHWTTNYYVSGQGFRGVLRIRTETEKTIPESVKDMCTQETIEGKYYINITQVMASASSSAFATGVNAVDVWTEDVSVDEYEQIRQNERALFFDFADVIKKIFGDTVSSKHEFVTVSFSVTSHETLADAEANTNHVMLYARNILFSNTYGSAFEVEDDYITPDLTSTPQTIENRFNGKGDYPSCVGVYQQRLCFAASENDPFSYWLSCSGDFTNFSTHDSIREDDAISATLAATEMPTINHLVTARDFMLFCDAAEWQVKPVTGNTLTYKTLSSTAQSRIGCAKSLKPIMIGDEIVFAKQTSETLLATRYSYSTDGYESTDLSVLSQWIFKENPIVKMAYRQHPDSVIECVLKDGTLATLVYMKEHEVCAWSRQVLGGGWLARDISTSKAISNNSTEVLLAVERDGVWQLWAERDITTVRNDTIDASSMLTMDALRTVDANASVEEGMTRVTVGDTAYAGYLYDAELVTVRPEPTGAESIQFEVKNAKDVEARVLQSGNFTVRGYGVPAARETEVETDAAIDANGSMSLASKDFKALLVGDNTGDGRIVLRSTTYYPLTLLSVATNYEIQPLSGSDG